MLLQDRVILGCIVTVPLWALGAILAWNTEHERRWKMYFWGLGVSAALLASWCGGSWSGLAICALSLPVAYPIFVRARHFVTWYKNRPVPEPAEKPRPEPAEMPRPAPAAVVRCGTRRCPFCAEEIQTDATKCKHCGEWLDSSRRDRPRKKRDAEVYGAISVGLGVVSVICTLMGCFTCGTTYFLAVGLALIGGLVGLFGEGGLRAAGLTLNILALLPTALVLFSGILVTLPAQGGFEDARARGAEAGRDEGRRAGKAAGFTTGADAAQSEAYRETLNHLYSSNEYRRNPFYTLAVVLGFFVLGFCLQWIVLYLPRKAGCFPDIDRLVLPKEMTKVDLADLTAACVDPRRLIPPSTNTSLVLLLAMLPLAGCSNPEQKAWQQGYDANRSAAYQEGWQEGAARGKAEGEEQGHAAARNAAETGRAWQLYSRHALWALVVGVIVGLSTQYTILAYCRISGRLPELLTVALVPAMKSSLAFAVLERRRQLLLWWDEEMRSLAAANRFRIAQIQTVHKIMRSKLRAISSLEDFTQTRLLELARTELSRIVSDSDRDACLQTEGQELSAIAPGVYTVTCPHCNKRIAYKGKRGGKTVNCPYENCGGPIHVPRV